MPQTKGLLHPDPNLPTLVFEALCLARRLDLLPTVINDSALDRNSLNASVDRIVARFQESGHTFNTPSRSIKSLVEFATTLRELAAKELERLEALGRWIPNHPTDDDKGDPALRTLAHLANNGASGIPLTLFVNGTQVCGYTVGGLKFYDDLAEKIAKGLASKVPTMTSQSVKTGALSHLIKPYTEKDDDVLVYFQPSFIHLRIQHTLTGTVTARWNGLVSRFRIDTISGFCYGMAEVTD